MAHEAGLTLDDMKLMNVGDVLDYVYSWVEFHDTSKTRTKKATQADIDRVFYG